LQSKVRQRARFDWSVSVPHVLVVDDDPFISDLVADLLLTHGFEVDTAENGAVALAKVVERAPDVIVLDLMMPEVDGFEVAEALNKHPDTARIPILVLTAKQITAEDRAKLRRYVTTIVDKIEFDPDRFIAEVRRAMAGRQLVA
jgi:CheY-like chemotaxis protein